MPRSSAKNEELRDISKEKIRNAALQKFSEKGFFATRIQDIAEEAGVSQGLLYRHYKSKEVIYVDLITEALNRIAEASINVSNLEMSATGKIAHAITGLFRTIETSERFRQTCRLIAQTINSSVVPPAIQEALNEKRDIPYRVISDIMRQGQEEGKVVEGDPDDLAILFWSAVNGLAIYYATRSQARPLPGGDYLLSMFLKHNGE